MSSWTEKRISHAARLWNEGLSSGEIVAALGDVSRSAVLGIMNRHRDRFPLRGRAGRSGPKPGSPRAAAPIRRAEKPKPAPPRPVPAPDLDSAPFLQAVEAGLCLFFAGPPLSASGPDMPVCGAPRASGRYCAHHAQRATQAGRELLEAAE
ncbi:hypothetical protein GRZ55_11325 [Chelativorans sp. ZYF759]|uniref:GcrA family cell cycle regulator n=1 Tax=Chelativorans sp. ZYF759 TaxID=2692213 RepID=UPI00145EDA15|nr:GcrA family cell cycle regulator [Chelativorans sp. ZYF759]NMG39835.1 hypothetical protein [Chelativorans sp. ZYF759]